MSLKIRPMTLKDIPEIVKLEKLCFTSDAWSAEDFEYRIECAEDSGNGIFLSLVAENGGFCGYIAAASTAGETYIDSIAVLPEKRRMGCARALLREVERMCLPEKLILEVRESNAAARSLYESEGYRELARRRGYYDFPPEDAIVYVKRGVL